MVVHVDGAAHRAIGIGWRIKANDVSMRSERTVWVGVVWVASAVSVCSCRFAGRLPALCRRHCFFVVVCLC